VPGARVTGKVERHEKFVVFVFLAPGRTALMPLSETGMAREADVARAFPVGSDVEVVVLEADSSGRRFASAARRSWTRAKRTKYVSTPNARTPRRRKGLDRLPRNSGARSSPVRSDGGHD
jgi:ribosomal protein S1